MTKSALFYNRLVAYLDINGSIRLPELNHLYAGLLEVKIEEKQLNNYSERDLVAKVEMLERKNKLLELNIKLVGVELSKLHKTINFQPTESELFVEYCEQLKVLEKEIVRKYKSGEEYVDDLNKAIELKAIKKECAIMILKEDCFLIVHNKK